MADDGFVFTDNLVNISNQLWAITAMVGAALCSIVLVLIGIVAMDPVSRPHLDRVSFRILVWALLANTVFGIVNAVSAKFTGPTWACGFTIFLLQFTLEMSSFLLFSIALNLQLVVIHQINGQKMEKFYIFGSIIISLCLTVPPYAAKQYGWNPLAQDCWYSSENRKERLAWQIGTQLFWTLLTVAGEFSTALAVIVYIVRHQLRNRKYLMTGTGSSMRLRSSSAVAVNNRVVDATVYRSVIFRIVIYPVVSAVINLTSVACVIHITQEDGVHNWTGYSVLLVSDFVYGGRAVLYALLAVTDPGLVRAVRAFIQSKKQDLSVQVELSTIHQNSGASMDRVDGAPAKYPGTSHSPTDYEDLKIRPRPDIEEGPRKHDDLQDLESAGVDATGNGGHIWLQEDMLRRREEMLARDRDRQGFKKQI
ncbi:hypothetical protein MVEN_02548100 [Mycena venus]|uniref:G-protein coupled receptors family 2 profile 2 domain-containing protein n=1 Tax=Mycena venus TaxID=2733690 RepID=A0A8H6U3V8_9AGAR|nr:hypothetical protein MVEN_02548100 [Mycena venus]